MVQKGYLYKTEQKIIFSTKKEYVKDKWGNQVYEYETKEEFGETWSIRHKVYEEKSDDTYFYHKLWYKFFRNKKECERSIELEHELDQKITKKEWEQFNYYYNYEKEKSEVFGEKEECEQRYQSFRKLFFLANVMNYFRFIILLVLYASFSIVDIRALQGVRVLRDPQIWIQLCLLGGVILVSKITRVCIKKLERENSEYDKRLTEKKFTGFVWIGCINWLLHFGSVSYSIDYFIVALSILSGIFLLTGIVSLKNLRDCQKKFLIEEHIDLVYFNKVENSNFFRLYYERYCQLREFCIDPFGEEARKARKRKREDAERERLKISEEEKKKREHTNL